MSSSVIDISVATAVWVEVTDDVVSVDLSDGRSLAVPLGWYPRLERATPAERGNWRFIGGGSGIHWPAIDEDVSVQNLLTGKPSGESLTSLQRWLAGRAGPKAS